MATVDIGIDLGTASVLVYSGGDGIVLREPSVVAVDTKTGEILSVGVDAYEMLGKTPAKITIIRPLQDGVISDYKTTERMIKYFLKKACQGSVVRPRVALCVPSLITNVEAQAVVDAAIVAGARSMGVFLIEEPVAAAIGAGIDIRRANGNLILDIGGGTTDIAIISLNGTVCKDSIKTAGNRFDEAILKYVRTKYGILIGERMAERVKFAIASVDEAANEEYFEIKGRHLITGLPIKKTICRSELLPAMLELAEEIRETIHAVIRQASPELVGDLHKNGMVMTGGGSLLHGMDTFLSKKLKLRAYLAPEPLDCVAIGTGRSFDYIDHLVDGFVSSAMNRRQF